MADKNRCATCTGSIGSRAHEIAEAFGWPVGEPQCLACMQDGIDPTLDEDELDHDLMAALFGLAQGQN